MLVFTNLSVFMLHVWICVTVKIHKPRSLLIFTVKSIGLGQISSDCSSVFDSIQCDCKKYRKTGTLSKLGCFYSGHECSISGVWFWLHALSFIHQANFEIYSFSTNFMTFSQWSFRWLITTCMLWYLYVLIFTQQKHTPYNLNKQTEINKLEMQAATNNGSLSVSSQILIEQLSFNFSPSNSQQFSSFALKSQKTPNQITLNKTCCCDCRRDVYYTRMF